jgi:hypothetical protein
MATEVASALASATIRILVMVLPGCCGIAKGLRPDGRDCNPMSARPIGKDERPRYRVELAPTGKHRFSTAHTHSKPRSARIDALQRLRSLYANGKHRRLFSVPGAHNVRQRPSTLAAANKYLAQRNKSFPGRASMKRPAYSAAHGRRYGRRSPTITEARKINELLGQR